MSVSAPGWLSAAQRCASPFYDARPDADDISLLVIHGISLPPRQYGGPYIDQLFAGTLDPQAHPYFAEIHRLEVSAHLLVRRDGSIRQYVPFTQRAWHAGASSWQGRSRCNDFSIGIELEGCDEEPYAAAQYEQLAQIIPALLQVYPRLSAQAIVGHNDIAPGRKTDPGPYFDWPRLRASLE